MCGWKRVHHGSAGREELPPTAESIFRNQSSCNAKIEIKVSLTSAVHLLQILGPRILRHGCILGAIALPEPLWCGLALPSPPLSLAALPRCSLLCEREQNTKHQRSTNAIVFYTTPHNLFILSLSIPCALRSALRSRERRQPRSSYPQHHTHK